MQQCICNAFWDATDVIHPYSTDVCAKCSHTRNWHGESGCRVGKDTVTDPQQPANPVQQAIFERLIKPGMDMPIRVHKREDLLFFARLVGVGPDWHEPDEQEISARLFGDSFDNTGSWAREESLYYSIIEEHHAVLYFKKFPVIAVNIATLFAWATED